MKRAIIIVLILAGVIGAVGYKINVIKKKRSAPTISIDSEYLKHGKPVETYEVKKGDMKFYSRFTGEYKNGVVQVWVSKIQWGNVHESFPVRVFEDGKSVGGKVVAKAKSADSLTGLYKIIVRPSKRLSVKEGQNVLVDAESKTISNVLSVPSAAIKFEEGKNYIWILKDKKAQRIEVEKGKESELHVQIVKGLAPGDRIIVRGASSLKKGDNVRIVKGGEL